MVVGFKQIEEANKAIKTIGIEKKNKKTGKVETKDYAEVFQKIKAFRMLFPMGSIYTEHEFIGEGVVLFKAFVKDDEGKLLGTGTAYEKEGSSFINQSSYIENCETSAIGRALSMCGIGIDLGVASYEEVANAMLNQNKEPEKVQAEVVEETPKDTKSDTPKGYPSRQIMMAIIEKRFPEGSKLREDLLAMNNLTSLDEMNINQVITLYNKFGGR